VATKDEDVTQTMPNQSEASANDPSNAVGNDPSTVDVGPTDAEIEAWAQQERVRRQSWLRHPAQGSRLARGESPIILMQRYAREAQLAAEGAMSLMLNHSMRDVLDQLVQAGRDWEDEYTSRPVRRRIGLDVESNQGGDPSQAAGGSKATDESPGTAAPTS